MPQTAHADPHEPPVTIVASGPREAFGLREGSPGVLPASAVPLARSRGFSSSTAALAPALRTRCRWSPRAGP